MKQLTRNQRKIQHFMAWYRRTDYNTRLGLVISIASFLFGTAMIAIQSLGK